MPHHPFLVPHHLKVLDLLATSPSGSRFHADMLDSVSLSDIFRIGQIVESRILKSAKTCVDIDELGRLSKSKILKLEDDVCGY